MAITPEEQVRLAEDAVGDLVGEGKEWLGAAEITLAYMKRHPDYLKRLGTHRQHAADSIRGLLHRPASYEKPRFKYRHEASLAVSELEAHGRLEHRFIDAEGRLRKDPPLPRSAEDRRYRLMDGTEKREGKPQDRFEEIAQRIEALPGASKDEEGQQTLTVASVTFGVNGNASRPFIVNLQVGYLPAREGAKEMDPHSITASWKKADAYADDPPAKEAYLSSDRLDGGQAAEHALGMLEDSVRAAELTHILTDVETEGRELFERNFTGPELAVEVRRDPTSHIL